MNPSITVKCDTVTYQNEYGDLAYREHYFITLTYRAVDVPTQVIDCGASMVECVKAIKTLTGLALREAKDVADGARDRERRRQVDIRRFADYMPIPNGE